MWYKSVNKAQFRSYVRQDTRLNVAYWTATKVVQMCELQANDLSLDQQITQMHSRVVSLLNAVKEEASDLSIINEMLVPSVDVNAGLLPDATKLAPVRINPVNNKRIIFKNNQL